MEAFASFNHAACVQSLVLRTVQSPTINAPPSHFVRPRRKLASKVTDMRDNPTRERGIYAAAKAGYVKAD